MISTKICRGKPWEVLELKWHLQFLFRIRVYVCILWIICIFCDFEILKNIQYFHITVWKVTQVSPAVTSFKDLAVFTWLRSSIPKRKQKIGHFKGTHCSFWSMPNTKQSWYTKLQIDADEKNRIYTLFCKQSQLFG